MKIYHKTSQATYFDKGDGSLLVVYKGNYRPSTTLCHFKNNDQGRKFWESVRPSLKKKYPKAYLLYRCPSDGRTYDKTNGGGHYGRKGHIRKEHALVVNVQSSHFDKPIIARTVLKVEAVKPTFCPNCAEPSSWCACIY